MNRMFREYEFTLNGFNFVASVDIESPFYQRVKHLPEAIYIQMNMDLLNENLFNKPMDIVAIRKKLEKFNAGGTYAFIELGVNN